MQKRLLTALATALALAATATAANAPLKVEVPKPLFAGTPRPISLANLEPANAKRPDIMVAPDVKLISKGKKVTSSDSLPVIGELTFITDGDKTGIDGAYVELGPNTQWVQVDLGSSAKIAAVAVWHFHSQARVYHDVVIQISDDAEFKKGVTTVFNTDDDNSSKLGKGADKSYVETNNGRVVDAKGANGRYVRLYSNGNTSDELNHYCEVEVFGVQK
ncbi:MAG: discoidin domain-containing protein [Opitutaceae bacterium]|nr:discoidin domain-containing protein [Opitutaceae bacterium]